MPTQRQITVRRAPKYVPFLVAGGLLGVVVAAVTSYAVPAPKDYTQGSVFGYFLVLFAAAGVLVGGVVALILDRVLLRRTERAVVEEVDEPEATTPPEATTRPEATTPPDGAELPAGPAAPAHDGEHAPSSAGGASRGGAAAPSAEGPEAGPAPAP
ncbi:hypothetical protein GCM10012320_21320 [Sinomonas cellulolyticus]|uniref:hypothetical protein n=1 Tax=Sinomonas cellulolyticus TaxID=2801916 RepID=UPI0019948854|nr:MULTISPECIES: hypothetical protein [Sinomonas]GHG51708.1 hypothetical protein GCM10012320_21320 [Sinomonas sp. KCTC 49339]